MLDESMHGSDMVVDNMHELDIVTAHVLYPLESRSDTSRSDAAQPRTIFRGLARAEEREVGILEGSSVTRCTDRASGC